MTDSGVSQGSAALGRRLVREDSYALVLLLILATIISSAFLGDGTVGVIIPLAFMSLTLVVTMSTSDAGPQARIVTRVVVAVAFLGVLAAELFHFAGLARLGFFIAMIALSTITPFVIIRRLVKHLTINLNTIAGAADIYLLIGVFYSVVYMTVGAVQAGFLNSLGPSGLQNMIPAAAFFSASRPTGPADFIYYSLVTMTTVGYGDLTATSNIGRMLSTTEALVGQLYLVTVVAVLVSRLGRSRQRPLHELAEQSEHAEPPNAK